MYLLIIFLRNKNMTECSLVGGLLILEVTSKDKLLC